MNIYLVRVTTDEREHRVWARGDLAGNGCRSGAGSGAGGMGRALDGR